MEQRVDRIASGLRCPVCQDLSAADSPSPIAQAMREEIARRLRAGQDPGAIRDYFVSRYGAWILLSPRFGGLNVVAWLLPAAGAIAGRLARPFLLRRRGGCAATPR